MIERSILGAEDVEGALGMDELRERRGAGQEIDRNRDAVIWQRVHNLRDFQGRDVPPSLGRVRLFASESLACDDD